MDLATSGWGANKLINIFGNPVDFGFAHSSYIQRTQLSV